MDIDSVSIEIQSNSDKAVDSINKLTNSLEKIKAAAKNATNDLKTFNNILQNMQNVVNGSSFNTGKIDKAVKSMKGFQNIKNVAKGTTLGTSNIVDFSSLQKDISTVEKFGKLMSIQSKNGEVQSKTYVKVADGIKTVTTVTGKAITETQKYVKEQNKLSKALGIFRRTGVLGALTLAYSKIMPKIQDASEFISNWNLFNTVMGESQEKAKNFIDTFSQGLGLDSSDIMKYISNFKSLTDSFGLAEEASYTMSKNLTQLSYDLAAFKGLSVEDAMQKLKSGIAGEIEPMRAIGIALDEASLQEVAYANGIKQRVNTMTRAQKTELLYYQIMHKTAQAQGYFGKTLLTPQTALITIRSQFTQLGRAIGNIFIPILMAAIPYVKAITQVLTEAAQAIAAFFGFQLQDYKISSSTFENISGGIDGIGNSAGKAAKELKGMLAPFDELNTIDFNKDSGAGGGSGGGVGGALGLPLYDYDALNGALDKTKEKVEKIKQFFYDIKDYVLAIGAAFAVWKIGKSVLEFLNLIGVISDKELPLKLKALVGIGLIVAGATLTYLGTEKMLKGEITPQNILKTALGSALIVQGAALAFNTKIPLKITLLVSLVFTLTVTILSWWNKYYEDTKKELYNNKKDLNLGEFLNVSFTSVGKGVEGLADSLFGKDFTKSIADSLSKNNTGRVILGTILDTVTGGLMHKEIKKEFNDSGSKMALEIATGIIKFFTNPAKFLADLGSLLSSNLDKVFKTVLKNILLGIADFVEKHFPIAGTQIANAIRAGISASEQNVSTTIEYTSKQALEDANPWIQQKSTAVGRDTFSAYGKGINEQSINSQQSIKESLERGYKNNQASLNKTASSSGGYTATSFSNEISRRSGNISKSINSTVSTSFSQSSQSLRNSGVTGGQQIASGVQSGFNSKDIKTKQPTFSWTAGAKATGWIFNILSALGLPTTLPKFKVSWITRYAEGGFPTPGELFIAGENGPEWVSTMGGQTAVANNDQMTEGIRQAAYEGVSQALRENPQSSKTDVYIGNEKVYDGYTRYANSQSNKYGTNIIRV